MISAKVIADSRNNFGNRITTMVVTFPRIILAEFNTHRMFSRNSASSRAIPFEKMVKSVEENPFIPIAWQKDHKGMQGTEYATDPVSLTTAHAFWLGGRNFAVRQARALHQSGGITKQLCNRILEPYMWHTVIVTATEWENFFALRCPKYQMLDEHTFRSHKDARTAQYHFTGTHLDQQELNLGQAEIHMMALAEAMWDAYNESRPKQLKAGEWHIPFGDKIELPPTIPIPEGLTLEEGVALRKVKIATARCARISYTTIGDEDKPFNLDKDLELHDKLLASGHMSPFEHCARAMDYMDMDFNPWSGNFQGFYPYRKMIPNENITSNNGKTI